MLSDFSHLLLKKKREKKNEVYKKKENLKLAKFNSFFLSYTTMTLSHKMTIKSGQYFISIFFCLSFFLVSRPIFLRQKEKL